jgi:hypothetical protein
MVLVVGNGESRPQPVLPRQIANGENAATLDIPVTLSVLTLPPGADLQQVHIEVRPVFFPTVTT